jgi:hypothetical protein
VVVNQFIEEQLAVFEHILSLNYSNFIFVIVLALVFPYLFGSLLFLFL